MKIFANSIFKENHITFEESNLIFNYDIHIPINIINDIIDNWSNDDVLSNIISNNNNLWIKDSDGRGIYWDLDTFKKYFISNFKND